MSLRGARYARVGWVDVRDVFVQADPFAAVADARLAVFTETALFSLAHKRKVYLDWSKNAWAYACDARYDAYAALPPVNLGVVLGDRAAVLDALERLVCDLGACGGWDQFVFSKLVYTDLRTAAAAFTTDDGPVANLCSNLDVTLAEGGVAVNAEGRPFALVHQWDRYDAVVAHVRARFPFDARR